MAACISVEAGGWLSTIAREAWEEQRQVVTRVGPGDPVLKRCVVVGVGPVHTRANGSTTVGLHWEDCSHPRLFPRLDADLVITPLPRDRARLEIMARYEPPLGAAGRAIDDALLHGLAESTVRAFLLQAAAVLEEAAVPSSGGGS